jgi:hypothetical protein
MGGGGFRSAAISPGAGGFRGAPLAANAFARPGFRGGDFDRGFRHHRGRGFAFGVGLGYGLYGPYGYYDDDYYDYPYYSDAYDDGGCYVVQRRVLTPYGWRLRPVQVCG